MKKMLLVFALLAATLPASASVRYRGGVFIGGAYRPWGWYGPWGSYYGYPMAMHPIGGQVKIDTKLKDAQVFINGGYAGTVKDVKSMWIRPGAYDLEVRAPSGEKFATRIFVVNGKTMHVRPDFHMPGNG
ncbi:MAG: hypothetical protein U0Q16_36620 [Bryobacteraceae bacterium]